MNTEKPAFERLIDSILKISNVEDKLSQIAQRKNIKMLSKNVLRKRVKKYVDHVLTEVLTYNSTILDKSIGNRIFTLRAKEALTALRDLGTKRAFGYAWTTFQNEIGLLAEEHKGNNYEGVVSTYSFSKKYHDALKAYGKEISIAEKFPHYDRFISKKNWSVSVDIDSMKELLTEEQKRNKDERRLSNRDTLRLQLLIYVAEQHNGDIPHYYEESEAGRIYFKGQLNLQNIKKLIRYTAIRDCYEYDLQAASYSLVAARAKQIDSTLDISVIENYVANRKKIRAQIAKDVFGHDFEGSKFIDIIKTALTLIGFSGRLQTLNENDPKTGLPVLDLDKAFNTHKFGNEMILKFIKHKEVKALHENLKTANKVLHDHYMNLNNQLEVRTGFKFEQYDDKGEKKGRGKRLAHIYQSLESMALDVLMIHAGDNLVLMLHDGILSKEQLNMGPIHADLKALFGKDVMLDVKVKRGIDVLDMEKQHIINIEKEEEQTANYSGDIYTDEIDDPLENIDLTTEEGQMIAELNRDDRTTLEKLLASKKGRK